MSDGITERDQFAAVLGYLPSIDDDAHVLHAHLDVLTGEFAEIHQDMLDVQGGLLIDDARGWHLLQWADRVGEEVTDEPEAQIRRFVKARLLTTHSSGEPNRLTEIARLLYNATKVRFVRVSTNQLAIYVFRDSYSTAAFNFRAFSQLITAAPAGDHIGPLAIVPPGYFGFTDDPDAEGWGGAWTEAA